MQEGKQYTGWQSSIYAKPDRQMPVRLVLTAKIRREGLRQCPANFKAYQTMKYQTSGASKSL